MPNTAWMQGGGWQLGFLVTKGNRAAQRTPFPGFWSRNTPKHVLLMLSPGFLTLTRLKESDGTICNSHAWPGRHRDGTSQYQSLAMTDDSTRHCLGPQNMGTLLQPLQEASPGTRPPDPNKGAQNRVTWWNAPPPTTLTATGAKHNMENQRLSTPSVLRPMVGSNLPTNLGLNTPEFSETYFLSQCKGCVSSQREGLFRRRASMSAGTSSLGNSGPHGEARARPSLGELRAGQETPPPALLTPESGQPVSSHRYE